MHTRVPAVSVVMPVRDAAPFIELAIASIRAQTFSDFEFIIVDDGSTDSGITIARRYRDRDPRIRILSQQPSGVAIALNRGLGEARGELIARMDADDISVPARLARQVEVMRANPSVAVLGSYAAVFDATNEFIDHITWPGEPDAIRDMLPRFNCIVHPTVMMRRDAVLAAGGYRPQYARCEDYDLWLRLSEHHDLMVLPEVLLLHRAHERQISRLAADRQALDAAAARHAATERRAGRTDPTPQA